MDITRVDTDGVRAILQPGQLGVDNYVAGNDVGRVYTGNGSVNKALAFRGEVVPMRVFNSLQLNTALPLYLGEIVFNGELGIHIWYNPVMSAWVTLTAGDVLTNVGIGTGTAGNYVQSFENMSEFLANWSSATLSTSLNTSSTGKWNVRDSATPSNNTGPSSAKHGSNFLYAETSSGDHVVDFRISTTKFAALTRIRGKYMLWGADCGTFEIIARTYTTPEVVLFTKSGPLSTSDTNWRNIDIDVTGMLIEELTFRYNGATGWSGDFGLDKIQLTSV